MRNFEQYISSYAQKGATMTLNKQILQKPTKNVILYKRILL